MASLCALHIWRPSGRRDFQETAAEGWLGFSRVGTLFLVLFNGDQTILGVQIPKNEAKHPIGTEAAPFLHLFHGVSQPGCIIPWMEQPSRDDCEY